MSPRGASIIFQCPKSFSLREQEIVRLVDGREQCLSSGICSDRGLDFIEPGSLAIGESFRIVFEFWGSCRGGRSVTVPAGGRSRGGCQGGGIVAGTTGIVQVPILVRGTVVGVEDASVLFFTSWRGHDSEWIELWSLKTVR